MSDSPRLLVVDDIADNRIILSRRLVRRGFEVVEADGGRAALEPIAQQPPGRAFGRRESRYHISLLNFIYRENNVALQCRS